ncbi:MAG: glycosyltransferase [Syntrophobacteraceae bacterium]
MTEEDFVEKIRGKRVLFVTPSDIDYIRNKQEIGILKEAAKHIDIIAPRNTHAVRPTGVGRIVLINLKTLFAGMWKYDVIFMAGLPQLMAPFSRFLFARKILIIDFFISLYDTLVSDRKVLSERNPLSRIVKWLDRHTLSKADCVIVDTRAHAGYFAGMYGVDAAKMAVIYLEADREIYYPRNVPRPEDLRDKFVVFFFGAMNPLQGVEVILDAARLLERHERIVFLIIGPREKVNNLERYSKLRNVRYPARWLPQHEVADYIAMSDVCLAGHFNAAVPKAGRVIPGKAYSYLAMDRPTILGDNPANRELFSEGTRNVLFVRMGDPEALANRIRKMADERSGAKE